MSSGKLGAQSISSPALPVIKKVLARPAFQLGKSGKRRFTGIYRHALMTIRHVCQAHFDIAMLRGKTVSDRFFPFQSAFTLRQQNQPGSAPLRQSIDHQIPASLKRHGDGALPEADRITEAAFAAGLTVAWPLRRNSNARRKCLASAFLPVAGALTFEVPFTVRHRPGGIARQPLQPVQRKKRWHRNHNHREYPRQHGKHA